MSDPRPSSEPPRPPGGRRDRLSLGVLMLMIAGIALGLVLISSEIKSTWTESGFGPRDMHLSRWDATGFLIVLAVLAGLSLVGPPLLLRDRWKRKIPWGEGRFFWFTQGTASWLLWPPVVYNKFKSDDLGHSASGVCFFYGTPLMALYVTLTLLAGGRLRRSRRRRLRRSGVEVFGLLLGLAWACTGAYVLAMLYRGDFSD